jgi:hypothetical protein
MRFLEDPGSDYPSTLQGHFIMPWQQVFMLSVKYFHSLPPDTIHPSSDEFSQQ